MAKPVRGIRPKKLPVAVSVREFTALVKNATLPHHKLAFLLAFGSGLRISEVLSVRPEQVDMDEQTIFIKEGKGCKDRVVPTPRGFRDDHLWMLPIKCGARALQMAFKKNAKEAGILDKKPTLHFHSLRHGFGTQCIRKGIDINKVKMLMGHESVSTTDIYIHLNPKEALDAYREKF